MSNVKKRPAEFSKIQPLLPEIASLTEDVTMRNVTDNHQEKMVENKARRVQGGIATTDLVFSAYQSDNADIFPKILHLHVPLGSLVADVTYGKRCVLEKCLVQRI